jgi:hypothetical protein
VRTLKRDYVRVSPVPDAEAVLRQLPSWLAGQQQHLTIAPGGIAFFLEGCPSARQATHRWARLGTLHGQATLSKRPRGGSHEKQDFVEGRARRPTSRNKQVINFPMISMLEVGSPKTRE